MSAASIHSSLADVWHLKRIAFAARHVKIITQNFNGPCSFIAICNILILRGQIEILPHDRTTVSYEFLSQLVGEYLLTNCPDIDISTALSVLPTTTKGLDLNPQFTNVSAFSPTGGELDLFAQAGIPLVHGWLVDPLSPEAHVMALVRDYDSAVTLIADADYITKGQLLGAHYEHDDPDRNQAGPSTSAIAGSSSRSNAAGSSPDGMFSAERGRSAHYSDEQRRKIEQAIVAQQFLDATKSQLTYHGLFQLASALRPGSLVALFRNAHLSVVYKAPQQQQQQRQRHQHQQQPDDSTSANDTQVNAGGDAETSDILDLDRDRIPEAETETEAEAKDADADSDAASAAQPVLAPSKSDPDAIWVASTGGALYALVTDDVFLHEPSIVWERLEDIDGGWSTFVDSDFRVAVPMGGDSVAAGGHMDVEADLADRELAKRLQQEEDEHAREVYQRQQQQEREHAERQRADKVAAERGRQRRWSRRPGASSGVSGGGVGGGSGGSDVVKRKKSKECVVM